jgi:hypothetical protein
MTDAKKPAPSKNQNGPGSPTADGRIWYTDNSTSPPSGYYVDPDPHQALKDAIARLTRKQADPYHTPGMFAVCQQIFLGYSQPMADHAAQDGIDFFEGDTAQWNSCANLNSLADSTWNNAVGSVVKDGASVADAWAASQSEKPKFSEIMLQSGCDFANGYLQYK